MNCRSIPVSGECDFSVHESVIGKREREREREREKEIEMFEVD